MTTNEDGYPRFLFYSILHFILQLMIHRHSIPRGAPGHYLSPPLQSIISMLRLIFQPSNLNTGMDLSTFGTLYS